MMKMFRLLVIPAVLMLSSCSEHLVRVKPYQRKNLANPLMDAGRDPLLLAMTQHAYFSREAAFGGGGVGGGGCGCN